MDEVPNRGHQLEGVNYFFVSLAFVCVLLRTYVRTYIVKSFAADDALMIVAMVFLILYCTFSNLGVHHGTGRHFVDLTEDNIMFAMRYWWLCYLTYAIGMIASKMSIGLFLLRIVCTRIHQWITYCAMALSVIAGLAFAFVSLFQCTPVSYFWEKRQDGKCLENRIVIGLAFFYSAMAIISDLTYVILPMFLLHGLNMKKASKLALIPLLTMGAIASGAVVVRFPFLLGLGSEDFLWSSLDTAIWSTVEQGLAISAGSLATTRPFFRVLGEKFGLVTRPSASGYQDQPSGLGLSGLHSKGYGGSRSHTSPANNLTFRDDTHGYHVHVEAETNKAPGSEDGIVVTTHRMQTGHHPNESEEWLARSDGRSVGRDV